MRFEQAENLALVSDWPSSEVSSIFPANFNLWSINNFAILDSIASEQGLVSIPTSERELPQCWNIGMPRLSGIQRDVLSLFRKCIRASNRKPVVIS